MSQLSSYPVVPFAVLRKLRLVRQRKLWIHAASAVVAALAVLLFAMGLAMLVDWLATLYDSRWRFVLTAAAIAAAILTSAAWLVLATRRLLGIDRIASDVDREIPQLAERWTTMTRLGDDAADPKVVHPAMLRQVATEAASWEPYVEPERIITVSPLMRAMICLTAVTAVLGIAIAVNSQRTLVLIKRFWLPGASISATQLVNVPGDVVVGRGEPLSLSAEVNGIPVEQAMLFMRSKSNDPREVSLAAQGEAPLVFAHRLRAVEESFDYRFRAGDGQTAWYTVGIAERPEIDKLQLTVTPPAYTRQPAKTFDNLPPRVSAIENSELELSLRPKLPVKTVELRLNSGNKVTLAADADGWYRWKLTLKDGFTLSPILTEAHGLSNLRAPECKISVYRDKPPTVKVLTPDDQLAVRPDDTIEIAFSASDDVGIGMAELLVYDEATSGEDSAPIAAIPIPLGEQTGARSLQETVSLDLKQFMVADGTALSYEVRVREDRGDLPSDTPQEPTANQIASGASHVNKSANDQAQSSQAAGSKSSPTADAKPDQLTNSQKTPTTEGQPTQTAGSQSPKTPDSVTQAPKKPAAASQLTKSIGLDRQVASREERHQNQAENESQSAGVPSSKQPANENLANPGARRTGSDGESNKDNEQTNKVATHSPTNPNASDGQSKSEPRNDATAQSTAAKPPNTSTDANRVAANLSRDATKPPAASEQRPPGKSESEATARTASSGRQALSSNRAALSSDETAQIRQSADERLEPQSTSSGRSPSSNPSRLGNQPQQNSKGTRQTAQNQTSSSQQQSPSGNQAANKANAPASPQSNPSPGDSMPRRSLDIPQTASSQRMRLKVDQWAGTFEGQQRSKLEMAFGPELESLDKALEKAQNTARGVLEDVERSGKWRPAHEREVTTAERSTVEAQERARKLQGRTKDTPYAFIGLQVADITLAHIEPARTNFWMALESQGDDRLTSVRDAAQHLERARKLVSELRGQYERTRREFQLAESVERVKKMYQVYLENSQALLQTQASDPSRYNRKMTQFELDDEYLKRLKEVLEMRRDLQAELARILADDPRLLRRFMDAMRYRTNNLREDLAGIVADQADLNREVRAWTLVDEPDRPKIARILLLKQVQDASKIATAAGELQSRYQTWLPLDREAKDADMAAATKTMQEMATAASELNATTQKFIAESQRAVVKSGQSTPATGQSSSTAANTRSTAEQDLNQGVDNMLADAQSLYDRLNKLELTLRQMAAREEEAEAALFAANRLMDTRRLVADCSAWMRQMRAHKAGNYAGAAEVDQYRLAMRTEEFAGKLGSIEQALASAMQRADGTLPEPIAQKAREFMGTLDRQVSPNQLASVYALHSNQMPRATQRQKAASEALSSAERAYDELMRLAIAELDKLPVQDPVSDLLDDPTLDELLAQLEQELPIAELLGIPPRPSNLQVIGDWLQPGSGSSGGSSGSAQMAMNQLRQDEQRAQQRLNQAYQRAIARALKEAAPRRVEVPRPAKLSDWNRLVSKLSDDVGQGRDKAPPEQYRRAIEQYFSQISRVADDETDAR
jgi:hypothetical protein